MSPAAGSSRWCPTSEQLMILEEMYKTGVRTPNASQIQHITAQLSLYGKIECKNVFYWFQNHKARDRQKLRRKLNKQLQLQQQQQVMHYNQQSHHFLDSFGSLPASSTQQLPFYNSAALILPQGEAGDASEQAITWKVHKPQRMVEKTALKFYNCDWKMMMDMSLGNSSCCSTKPLKTLELFPITADKLKENCTK